MTTMALGLASQAQAKKKKKVDVTRLYMIIKWRQNKPWFSPVWLDDSDVMTSTMLFLLIEKIRAIVFLFHILTSDQILFRQIMD